jgi:hypothetical protein
MGAALVLVAGSGVGGAVAAFWALAAATLAAASASAATPHALFPVRGCAP